MNSDSASSRGYGPAQNTWFKNRLCFDGDQRKFELWHVKFMGYLKLRGLKDVVDPPAVNAATNTATVASASGGGGTASGTNSAPTTTGTTTGTATGTTTGTPTPTTTGTGTDPEKKFRGIC